MIDEIPIHNSPNAFKTANKKPEINAISPFDVLRNIANLMYNKIGYKIFKNIK